MKKIIAVALLVCCIVLCTGCGKPSGMSPEETVRYRFEQWNSRNSEGMNSVVYTKVQRDYDFTDFQSITLDTCEEVKDKEKVRSRYQDQWYDKTPYDIAMVEVCYYLQWVSETEFRNDHYEYYNYYLVKDSEDSDWIIVNWE